MSEEELIKYIKGLTEITKENNKRGIEVGVEISVDMAEQVLNLIKKQQKEIENSVSKDKIREYIQHEIWLCEHDIDACCDDEIEIRNHFVKRKKIFEEIQKRLLEE